MNSFSERLDAACAEYLRRVSMENLSKNTYANYENVIKCFCEFVRETEQPNEFVAVVEWKTRLFENGLQPSTIRQYLITLQIFFGATSHKSYSDAMRFEENPVDKALLPKVPERPYEIVLTDEQVMLLFRNEAPPYFGATWARNWAMIQLCMNEKIRNAELLDLKLSDVDMREHILIINSGKGRKYREVDLCPLSEFAICQYLESGIRPAYLSDDDYLFGTTSAHVAGQITARSGAEKWHRGTTNFVSTAIERTIKAITGVSGCRSHDLRHIGSRVCLNAGQSLEEIQGALGHAHMNTTQIYTSRMNSRRGRESAKAVLAARDAAAERLIRKNRYEQKVIPLYA